MKITSSLSLALFVLTGCVEDSPDDVAAPKPPEPITFEQWLEQSGKILTDAQRAQYEAGVALVGLVPEHELPVRHPRSALLELPPGTFAKIDSGELDFRRDFESWANAGLYDPDDHEQVAAARATGAITDVGASGATAVANVGAETEQPGEPNNCKVVLKLRSEVKPWPAAMSSLGTTQPCDPIFTGHGTLTTLGAAPMMTARASGGSPTQGGFGAFQCTQQAQNQEVSHRQFDVRADFVYAAIDPNKAPNCPLVNPTVQARGRAAMLADLHLGFTKRWDQWNPAGGLLTWLNKPWRARAGGVVEAYVGESRWSARAQGDIEMGSECHLSESASASFSASVSPETVSAGGSGTFSVTTTCSTQAWAAASQPRDQRLRAHVDEADITLTRTKPQVALSVKASNFVAEAWSSDPAEGRPWYERWGVDSTASATTRGGCMSFKVVDCQINETPHISCELPEKLELVDAPNGVECAPFSGLGPLPVAVEDTPPEPPAP